jgi:hypothetical protein
MNVKEKLWPGARSPELKRPPFAATVWVTASRFVNVTRVPVWTLRLEGVNAKPMMVTAAAVIGGTVGRGVGAGVGRGVETGRGVATGVSTGVGEAVGDSVALAAAGESDGGGEDWLVACVPQPARTHAATIANAFRSMGASVEKISWRLIPADVTTV